MCGGVTPLHPQVLPWKAERCWQRAGTGFGCVPGDGFQMAHGRMGAFFFGSWAARGSRPKPTSVRRWLAGPGGGGGEEEKEEEGSGFIPLAAGSRGLAGLTPFLHPIHLLPSLLQRLVAAQARFLLPKNIRDVGRGGFACLPCPAGGVTCAPRRVGVGARGDRPLRGRRGQPRSGGWSGGRCSSSSSWGHQKAI